MQFLCRGTPGSRGVLTIYQTTMMKQLDSRRSTFAVIFTTRVERSEV